MFFDNRIKSIELSRNEQIRGHILSYKREIGLSKKGKNNFTESGMRINSKCKGNLSREYDPDIFVETQAIQKNENQGSILLQRD